MLARKTSQAFLCLQKLHLPGQRDGEEGTDAQQQMLPSPPPRGWPAQGGGWGFSPDLCRLSSSLLLSSLLLSSLLFSSLLSSPLLSSPLLSSLLLPAGPCDSALGAGLASSQCVCPWRTQSPALMRRVIQMFRSKKLPLSHLSQLHFH